MTQPMYIISVEGTLVTGDTTIHPDFKNWFMKWASKREVYLTSNNTFSRTMQQLGSYLCLSVTEVNHCCGNAIWAQGRPVSKTKTVLPSKIRAWLEFELAKSDFPTRVGERIEERPGMIYGTIPGIDASQKERVAYVTWDKQYSERRKIVEAFNVNNPGYVSFLDGDVGISVTDASHNKGQLVGRLKNGANNQIVFIGHNINSFSNDQTVVDGLSPFDTWHSTADWHETWKLLKLQYVQPTETKKH